MVLRWCAFLWPTCHANNKDSVYLFTPPLSSPPCKSKDRQTDRQTDRQNVLFAIKNTNMMINNETVKRQEISIKIETIADLPPTSSHLHPLQVENCDSNTRLVVVEDDNVKFRLKRDKQFLLFIGQSPLPPPPLERYLQTYRPAHREDVGFVIITVLEHNV